MQASLQKIARSSPVLLLNGAAPLDSAQERARDISATPPVQPRAGPPPVVDNPPI